jgi:hypothetical protein
MGRKGDSKMQHMITHINVYILLCWAAPDWRRALCVTGQPAGATALAGRVRRDSMFFSTQS